MNIVVYAGSHCLFSRKLIHDLQDRNIPVDIKLVDKDEKACEEMYRLTKKAWTPTVKITLPDQSEKIIVGYNSEKKKQYEDILGTML